MTDAFPREQLGLAMGTNTMVAAVGLVLGPVLGGALVAISWHWVFWFNVPLGLAGAAWGGLVLRELSKPDTVRGLDIGGTLLFVTGLTGLVFGVSKGGLSGWSDPLVIGSLVAAAVLLPAFVLVEKRGKAPMLDLTIFQNRMFAAASGAAFINGLSRFALLFVFVFYFQGAQGDDPITAGLKLAPMAIGMLVSSPLAGWWADQRGSRALAAWGMVVSAVGLAAMTTLQADSPYWQSSLWLLLVGVGSGMFNSPNTAAMMGTVPPAPARDRGRRADDAPEHRRRDLDRLRDGGRDRGGAAARPLQDLLRPGRAASRPPSSTRSSTTCTPRCGCWRSPPWSAPASRSCARATRPPPSARSWSRRTARRGGVAMADATLRIGEVAKRTGTTPRTIRYYEEIGLLPDAGERPRGSHRVYREADVERLGDVLRLKELLGLSLDELRDLVEAEDARASLRREWHEGIDDPVRRREVVEEALGHIERQLALVRRRRDEIAELERELRSKRRRLRSRLTAERRAREPA